MNWLLGKPACLHCECTALEREGIDITLLLANRINHPLPEMHDLFARLLLKTLLGEDPKERLGRSEDGMTAAAK